MIKYLQLLVWTTAIAMCIPTRALAQATELIDPVDPVYRDVERLVASGLVDRVIVGQRPYSRLQLAAIVMQAQRRIDSTDVSESSASDGPQTSAQQTAYSAFLRQLILAIRARFAIEVTGQSRADRFSIRSLVAPLRAVSVDVTQANSPTRSVPADNGLGTIDAVVNPLLSNRQGRPLVSGTNALVASEHVIESSHFALVARPELQSFDGEGRNTVRGDLQELELRLLFHNVAIDAGREYATWGQGFDVGMLGSNNSPPLNSVRLSNEQLLILPWIFRHLGPSRFSIFYSKLGSEQNYPYPYFVGYKASFEPSSRFELGGVVYSKSGGQGAPRGTFSARIIDLLPFLDASDYANKIGLAGNFQFSDRYAGFDGRLRFPSLRSSEIYTEILLNDFDIRRLSSVLWQDAGHVFGLDVSRLSSDGRVGAWFEYHHTGDRYYEHTQFTSGQTSNRELIGDPLGPDAQGLYGNLDWYRTVRDRFSMQLAVERRSNDQFMYWPVPLPRFGWSRVESRPKELRERVLFGWTRLPSRQGLGAFGQIGFERVQNFDFVSNGDRNNFLGRVGLQYLFP